MQPGAEAADSPHSVRGDLIRIVAPIQHSLDELQ
jgi:hypothetical protein